MVESKFDLTNQRFGKLTVMKRVYDIYDNGMPTVAYLCRCDCGKERIYRQASLRHGGAKTCGSSECRKGRATIYNTYDLSGDYGIGYTRKGEEFYFDKEDEDESKVGVRLERGKWLASITVDGKTIGLGEYDNYDDAVRARIDAEKKYWGEYRMAEN